MLMEIMRLAKNKQFVVRNMAITFVMTCISYTIVLYNITSTQCHHISLSRNKFDIFILRESKRMILRMKMTKHDVINVVMIVLQHTPIFYFAISTTKKMLSAGIISNQQNEKRKNVLYISLSSIFHPDYDLFEDYIH